MNFLKKITGFSLLALAVSAGAQNTTVSATVTDSDGTLWTNGSWSLSFVPNPQNPNISQYRIGGAPLSTTVMNQQGVISNTATFSIVMYDNTAITPVGSGWTLNVCPQANSACGIYNFSTAGATLNISSALTSIIPAPRFKAVSGAYGYVDLEAQPQNIPGANYYNVQSGCQKYYNTLTLTWSCFAGGATFLPIGGGTLTGPLNAPIINNVVYCPTSSTIAVCLAPYPSGTVKLQLALGTYQSGCCTGPGWPIVTPHVTIEGSSKPDYASDFSHLVGGTIIQGPLWAGCNTGAAADFFTVRTLGIDMGPDVVTSLYGGTPNNAFVMNNVGQVVGATP